LAKPGREERRHKKEASEHIAAQWWTATSMGAPPRATSSLPSPCALARRRPRRRPLRPPPVASPTEERERERERCGHEGEGGRRGGESTVATSPEPADARRRWHLRRISRRKRETRGRRQAGTGVLVGIRLGCNLLPKIQPTAIKSLC
jgi:hypothetical protein